MYPYNVIKIAINNEKIIINLKSPKYSSLTAIIDRSKMDKSELKKK